MIAGEMQLRGVDERGRAGWAIAILVVIVALVGRDIATDAWTGARWLHWVLELVVAALSAAGAVTLWLRMLAARRAAGGLTRDLAASRADADKWRRKAESSSARPASPALR